MKYRYLKYLAILFLVPMLQACPPVFCEPKTINYPPLSEESLKFIPYENGDTLVFKHSKGAVIIAHCTRVRTQEYDGCAECCTQYTYEVDNTSLKFNYPIPNFNIRLSNLDSTHVALGVNFSTSSVDYPIIQSDLIHDSLMINGEWYENVYALPFYHQNYSINDSFKIYADSLYFNSSEGVIKICMSNGEYFTRYED